MNLEEARKELQEYYNNKTIIDNHKYDDEKIRKLFERATKITTTITDAPGGQNIPDKIAECVAEYVDIEVEKNKLEIEYEKSFLDLRKHNLLVHKTIMDLHSHFKGVLINIYEEKHTREETAEIMKMSRQWVDITLKAAELAYMDARNKKV